MNVLDGSHALASRHPWWPAIPFWIGIALLSIFQHGPMPMYSTRALSVAWEMWHQHSFMVPLLNGTPYSDKPPLLFWLIQLGWYVTGVSDTWPRVLEVGLGATELWLAMLLARRLFPGSDAVARATPWLLMAFSYGFLFRLADHVRGTAGELRAAGLAGAFAGRATRMRRDPCYSPWRWRPGC